MKQLLHVSFGCTGFVSELFFDRSEDHETDPALIRCLMQQLSVDLSPSAANITFRTQFPGVVAMLEKIDGFLQRPDVSTHDPVPCIWPLGALDPISGDATTTILPWDDSDFGSCLDDADSLMPVKLMLCLIRKQEVAVRVVDCRDAQRPTALVLGSFGCAASELRDVLDQGVTTSAKLYFPAGALHAITITSIMKACAPAAASTCTDDRSTHLLMGAIWQRSAVAPGTSMVRVPFNQQCDATLCKAVLNNWDDVLDMLVLKGNEPELLNTYDDSSVATSIGFHIIIWSASTLGRDDDSWRPITNTFAVYDVNQEAAVLRIQCATRCRQARLLTERRRDARKHARQEENDRDLLHVQATAIQAQYRGMKARSEAQARVPDAAALFVRRDNHLSASLHHPLVPERAVMPPSHPDGLQVCASGSSGSHSPPQRRESVREWLEHRWPSWAFNAVTSQTVADGMTDIEYGSEAFLTRTASAVIIQCAMRQHLARRQVRQLSELVLRAVESRVQREEAEIVIPIASVAEHVVADTTPDRPTTVLYNFRPRPSGVGLTRVFSCAMLLAMSKHEGGGNGFWGLHLLHDVTMDVHAASISSNSPNQRLPLLDPTRWFVSMAARCAEVREFEQARQMMERTRTNKRAAPPAVRPEPGFNAIDHALKASLAEVQLVAHRVALREAERNLRVREEVFRARVPASMRTEVPSAATEAARARLNRVTDSPQAQALGLSNTPPLPPLNLGGGGGTSRTNVISQPSSARRPQPPAKAEPTGDTKGSVTSRTRGAATLRHGGTVTLVSLREGPQPPSARLEEEQVSDESVLRAEKAAYLDSIMAWHREKQAAQQRARALRGR